jgi:hypothetical protein
MTDPECNGKRLFAFAGPFNANRLLSVLRKLYPDKSFVDDRDDSREDLSRVPNAKAEALLKKHYGHGFTSLEDSIRANTEGLSQ